MVVLQRALLYSVIVLLFVLDYRQQRASLNLMVEKVIYLHVGFPPKARCIVIDGWSSGDKRRLVFIFLSQNLVQCLVHAHYQRR